MTTMLTLAVVLVYIALLFVVSHFSGSNRVATAPKRYPQWLVTLAMVGAAITGITFISLPGSVGTDAFSYLQMNLGFIIAYVVIAYWLIPLYYRHKVVSLYEYLHNRFGLVSQTAGALLFLIAKIIGTALRTFVACLVLQQLLGSQLGVSFWVTTIIFMALAWFYTHRGGVSSVIWADLIKTVCLVSCVALSMVFVLRAIGLPIVEALKQGSQQGLTQIFFFDDFDSSRHFVKLLLSGIFMVIATTGLDQDLMQRVLVSDTTRSAQRNMVLSSFIQVPFIAMMLILGALFFLYLGKKGISGVTADEVFAFISSQSDMPMIMGTLLVLGVVSTSFSSIGGSLTGLTTSFMVDILHGRQRLDEGTYSKINRAVHLIMAVVMIAVIFAFKGWGEGCSLNLYFMLASYTYGPLLGMFTFGFFSKRKVLDKFVPLVIVLAPFLSLVINNNSQAWFGGYQFGFEILLVNVALTMVGLTIISRPANKR